MKTTVSYIDKSYYPRDGKLKTLKTSWKINRFSQYLKIHVTQNSAVIYLFI